MLNEKQIKNISHKGFQLSQKDGYLAIRSGFRTVRCYPSRVETSFDFGEYFEKNMSPSKNLSGPRSMGHDVEEEAIERGWEIVESVNPSSREDWRCGFELQTLALARIGKSLFTLAVYRGRLYAMKGDEAFRKAVAIGTRDPGDLVRQAAGES